MPGFGCKVQGFRAPKELFGIIFRDKGKEHGSYYLGFRV